MTNATLNKLLSFNISSRNQPQFSLNPQQQQFLPDPKDIAWFQQHGWYATEKILPNTLIDRIYEATEELYAGKVDAQLPIANCSNWQQGDRGGIRNNEYISFQKKAFHELTLQPLIGAIAAKLMETKTVRYFQDQLVSKEANSDRQQHTKVGWHTDRSYHSNCTSDKLLTVWIPLHDVTIEHGCLVMVDGSHKWSATEHMRGFNQDNHQDIEQQFVQQGKKFQKIPIELKKGQISFHHSSIVHGSFQNHSQIMRRAIVMNLQDGENSYQNYWNNGRQIHHCLDNFCRLQASGLPDYSDPDVFPVVWSQA